MALYCNYLQSSVYNAPDDRFGQAALLSRDASGAVVSGLLYATPNDGLIRQTGVPSRNITVAAFTAALTDGARGAYIGGSDATVTMAVTTPDTANNRVDVLCWRPLEGRSTTATGATVNGSVTLADGTALTKQVVTSELFWVVGSPSSSATPPVPAVPAGALPLGQVFVGANAASITTSNITDRRSWTTSVGGTVIDNTAAKGASSTLAPGQRVYNVTTDTGYVVDSNRKLVAELKESVWQAFTPTLLASGSVAVGNGSIKGRYLVTGKNVRLRIQLIGGTTTAFGYGPIRFGNLPFPATGGLQAVGLAHLWVQLEDWPGFSTIPDSASEVRVFAPFNATNTKHYQAQNADGNNGVGTGIPRYAGIKALGNGTVIEVDITYEIA